MAKPWLVINLDMYHHVQGDQKIPSVETMWRLGCGLTNNSEKKRFMANSMVCYILLVRTPYVQGNRKTRILAIMEVGLQAGRGVEKNKKFSANRKCGG